MTKLQEMLVDPSKVIRASLTFDTGAIAIESLTVASHSPCYIYDPTSDTNCDRPTRSSTQAANSKIIIDSRDYKGIHWGAHKHNTKCYKIYNKGADNAKVQWEVQWEVAQSA